MCGVAGVHHHGSNAMISKETLLRMIAAIRHRGPDQCGIYLDDEMGFAHARLSIIDLEFGIQPLHNENKKLWLIYNGEIYNYIELRKQLERKGHRFGTRSDGEVIIHLYEDMGVDCLNVLNGQFAIALWDSSKRQMMLARDRFGIRPLYYSTHENKLYFASEIKAIFAGSTLSRQIDPVALHQIFTFWTTLPGRTLFKDVWELSPGTYLLATQNRIRIVPYWDVPLSRRDQLWSASLPDLCDEIRTRLKTAIQMRLRADVPVGCYLSGGLDSSILTTLVTQNARTSVRTFGMRFEDAGYDEGLYQELLTTSLDIEHENCFVRNRDIGTLFNRALWHCEKPLLRTSPIPLYALSQLVQERGYKVVLSGEGADEVFGGYNIFREAKIRRFWARQVNSHRRAGLTERLYPYIARNSNHSRGMQFFFRQGLKQVDDPFYSHRLRWTNARRIKSFLSRELRERIEGYDGYEEIREDLPDAYWEADWLSQAQYLEMKIFLSNYLLSSQGDRMAMAHAVEIRLPYLDHHLVSFMSRVPSKWKIFGLNEKHILKRCYQEQLPNDIVARSKQPYRAPIDKCFMSSDGEVPTEDLIDEQAMRAAGLFDIQKTRKLMQKLHHQKVLSEMENMALVSILSTQSIHQQFVASFPTFRIDQIQPGFVVDCRSKAKQMITPSTIGTGHLVNQKKST